MKKFKVKNSLILFGSILALCLSCQTPNPPDPYIRFTERWKFIKVESNVNQVSTDPLALEKDVSGQELYIRFNSNQDFITNADLSLSKLLVDNRSNFRGTYYYFKENGDDRMILEFFDEAIRENVALYFFVNNMSSGTPSLVMDTNDYKTSINESADEINSDISDDLKAFANRIITANFLLEFEKQ